MAMGGDIDSSKTSRVVDASDMEPSDVSKLSYDVTKNVTDNIT